MVISDGIVKHVEGIDYGYLKVLVSLVLCGTKKYRDQV
jgi:hypothetical protein